MTITLKRTLATSFQTQGLCHMPLFGIFFVSVVFTERWHVNFKIYLKYNT